MPGERSSKRFASLKPESKATIGEKLKYWRENRRDNYSILSDKTQSTRDQLWEDWRSFFSQIGEDPDKIWLDLCDNSEEARVLCLVFLEECVDNSLTLRPVLGPEENALVQTITSANSLLKIWKGLIAHADEKVLQKQRKIDPNNRAHWKLQYTPNDGGRNRGPANRVASAIQYELTQKKNLVLEQTFVKREATTTDVLLILETVWIRALDIPCSPSDRVAFHCVILISAIGGFRPEVILGMKYRDVRLIVVRDPGRPQHTKLIINVTIHQNKRSLHKARDAQDETLSFSITVVPDKLICLITLLVSRALVDGAFDRPYKSMEEILTLPRLEQVDYLELSWKPEALDKEIIPLKYAQYNKIWHLVIAAAGFRDGLRPTSMRVGAGARLGALSGPLRNYILSNTTLVYERNYQPQHVRENLMGVAFRDLVDADEELFQTLRNASLSRDGNAPLYVSKADLDGYNKRNDITQLRQEYEAEVAVSSSKSILAKRLAAKIKWTIDWLCELRVKELREVYFREVDKLRSFGQSTQAIRSAVTTKNPRTTYHQGPRHDAVKIGELLEKHQDLNEKRGDGSDPAFGKLIIAHLRGEAIYTPTESPADSTPIKQETLTTKIQSAGRKREKARCLICGQTLKDKSKLTRHVRAKHTFDKPFQCPACKSQGESAMVATGGPAWAAHVERKHEKQDVPTLTGAEPTPTVPCSLCYKPCRGRLGLSLHLNQHHRTRGHFEKTQTCTICNTEVLGGVEDWIEHSEKHGKTARGGGHSGLMHGAVKDRETINADGHPHGIKRDRDQEVEYGTLHSVKRVKRGDESA